MEPNTELYLYAFIYLIICLKENTYHDQVNHGFKVSKIIFS